MRKSFLEEGKAFHAQFFTLTLYEKGPWRTLILFSHSLCLDQGKGTLSSFSWKPLDSGRGRMEPGAEKAVLSAASLFKAKGDREKEAEIQGSIFIQ